MEDVFLRLSTDDEAANSGDRMIGKSKVSSIRVGSVDYFQDTAFGGAHIEYVKSVAAGRANLRVHGHLSELTRVSENE